MTISLEQQIACVRRELAMRKNVYPKWVASGRMGQDKADHELAALQAVHDTLTEVVRLHARLALAGKYLQEICDAGNDWGGTACAAHAFLALGNAIHPRN